LVYFSFDEIRKCGDDIFDGRDLKQFKADELRQHAIAQALTNFGETVGRLMTFFPKVVENNPDVEWHQIKGLRNRITHDYYNLDFVLIYNIVKTELPFYLRLFGSLSLD
jgi:uncharacterized protein with HEPN domain